MLLDHAGKVFFPNIIMLNIVGRLAFPLFAWSIAQGIDRTKNFSRYATRLAILAIVSQYPYNLLLKNGLLNVCFTLLTGLLIIKLLNTEKPFSIKLLIIMSLLTITHFLNFDYGVYGVATIVAFYICKNDAIMIFSQTIITLLATVFCGYYSIIQLAAVMALPTIIMVKKYDIKVNKTLFYAFYPTHLMLLYLARLWLQTS
jgi:hypothetical protein